MSTHQIADTTKLPLQVQVLILLVILAFVGLTRIIAKARAFLDQLAEASYRD